MKKLTIFSMLFIVGIEIQAQNISINVDVSQKHQIIDNFAASDCWWAHKIGDFWKKSNKDSIADLLFSPTKGIGLSAWRFNLGAGFDANISDSWRTVKTFQISPGQYDWSRNEGGQWFLKAAKERGVDQFIAFVNSPPKNMTRNGHTYCTDGLGSTNLKDGYYNQFSAYLVDILKHFRDSLGVNFDYISPVNEPQWEWNGTSQEGNRASNNDIKKIVDSLYAKLDSQNISTQIIIPESGSLPNWYTTESSISSKYGEIYGNYLYSLFNDSNVTLKAAKIFAGHSYWSDLLSSEVVQARQSLYNRMGQFLSQDYKYWVTEYCILEGSNGQGGNGRDLTMTTALDIARIIHFDLTIANASAWQWWLAVSKYDYKDGLIYTDYSVLGMIENIIQSKTLWILGNFSRFIRPGSKRINCSGANDKYGLMASAYLDSASTKLITVFVNVSNESKDITFNLSGLDSTQVVNYMTPYVTSDNSADNLKAYPDVSVDSVYSIPAKSVVTMIGMLDGSAMTKINEEKKIPKGFRLYQNYPNPFNPETTIKYSIPETSFVRLEVYNTLSQKIAVLVKQEQNMGEYTVEFDASNLASGLYFYKLNLDNKYVQINKMLLVK
jgi:O-glycosyl hydrolase